MCVALVGTTMIRTGAAHGASVADKCEAAKNKVAGKYALCRQKAEAKAIKTASTPDFTKCDPKFSQKWATAEAAGGGMCPTQNDEAAMQSCIAAHTSEVAAALMSGGTCGSGGLPETGQTQCDQGGGTLGACPGSPAGQDGAVLAGAPRSYTDNGDGTITDNVTGLMWEKLSNDGTIHDYTNTYDWYSAFTTKIAALNSESGFAGHTDWRLPNQFELYSLVDFGLFPLVIDPAFNTGCAPGCNVTTCSCTWSGDYWSSTTYQPIPIDAWSVDFGSGIVDVLNKSTGPFVRAVRGGS